MVPVFLKNRINAVIVGTASIVIIALIIRNFTKSKQTDEEGADVSEELEKEWLRRRSVSQKKLSMNEVLEICCSDMQSCIEAVEGGATSLELCSNRLEGGVTPSIGFIQSVVQRFSSLDVQIHVLVRPRPGNFSYSAAEFEVILRDICMAQKCGVDGIVVGILHGTTGFVDEQRMLIVRHYCSGMLLTFHRAFDVMRIQSSLEEEYNRIMVTIGCDRLLTSGRSSSACTLEGTDTLAQLVALEDTLNSSLAAAGKNVSWPKVTVAAGGITASRAASLVRSTGVKILHLGSAVCRVVGEQTGYGEAISMGSSCSGSMWACVDAVLVEEVMVQAGRQWESTSSTVSLDEFHDTLDAQEEEEDVGHDDVDYDMRFSESSLLSNDSLSINSPTMCMSKQSGVDPTMSYKGSYVLVDQPTRKDTVREA